LFANRQQKWKKAIAVIETWNFNVAKKILDSKRDRNVKGKKQRNFWRSRLVVQFRNSVMEKAVEAN
jgi:hypothetical protein